MNATKRIIATLALAAGMAVAGGLWTQELNVGTNGVTLAATQGTEWRLVDALSPSNTAVAVEYVTATTNSYAAGGITNGILTVRGSVIPPVADRARLVLKAANGTVPVLAIFEGAGVTAE